MSKKVAAVERQDDMKRGGHECYGIVGDTLNTFAKEEKKCDIEFFTSA